MERDTVLIDLALQGGGPHEASPAYIAMDLMSRVLSPYNLNTLGLNPLRSVDFDRLARSPIQLYPAVGASSTTPRHRRRSARFGLSPDDVPGNRNRRRPQTGMVGSPAIQPLRFSSVKPILVRINPRGARRAVLRRS
jgi:hypothetical protein